MNKETIRSDTNSKNKKKINKKTSGGYNIQQRKEVFSTVGWTKCQNGKRC